MAISPASTAGNRTRLTWPDGFYVTTDYDALNRPTTLKEMQIYSDLPSRRQAKQLIL